MHINIKIQNMQVFTSGWPSHERQTNLSTPNTLGYSVGLQDNSTSPVSITCEAACLGISVAVHLRQHQQECRQLSGHAALP